MPYQIKSSELASMTEEEREHAFAALVLAAKNGTRESEAVTNARIRQYEKAYNMQSDEMQRRFAVGEIRETPGIVKWIALLEVRKRNEQR